MPCAATSAASVFDQPRSEERSAFEVARLAIGVTIPEEALVTIRPQPRSRMPGSASSVSAIGPSTIASNWRASSSGSRSAAVPGGGPPLLLTRISTAPTAAAARSKAAPRPGRSARSSSTATALPPAAPIASTVRSRLARFPPRARHLRALGGERRRDRPAQPAAGADHQRATSIDSKVHLQSPCPFAGQPWTLAPAKSKSAPAPLASARSQTCRAQTRSWIATPRSRRA